MDSDEATDTSPAPEQILAAEAIFIVPPWHRQLCIVVAGVMLLFALASTYLLLAAGGPRLARGRPLVQHAAGTSTWIALVLFCVVMWSLFGVSARLAIEAGVAQGWERYLGPAGDVVSLERFGASAPYKVLMKQFGFTPEAVAERALHLLER